MLDTYRKILDLLDSREKLHFWCLLLMVLAMSMLEVAGVASILPFLGILTNPSSIHENTYLAYAYSRLGFQQDRSFLLFAGSAVFVLVVVGLAFKAITLYALTYFSTMRNYSISSRLLSSYLAQPYIWFVDHHSAELGKTVLSEVHEVVHSSIIPGMHIAAHATVASALAILLFVVEPVTMTIAVGLLAGVYAAIYFALRKRLRRIGERRVHANRNRFQIANEAMGGIKEIKLLGLEKTYLDRFRGPAREFARAQASATIMGQTPRYVLEATAFGGMIAFLLAVLAFSEGSIDALVPTLGLFAFAGIRMFPAMQQVYQNFTRLQFGKFALEAMHRDLTQSGQPALEPAPSSKLGLNSTLELRGVSYTYPKAGRRALDHIDLKIEANTSVGLVGGSGAGKTTIVDVILGLLSPDAGILAVDGIAISDDNRRQWQRSIGYVPQQIYLTDDTIAANIAFGLHSDDVDLDAVYRAAAIAELHDFVTQELPAGYKTLVGERGVRLSGGQRQRIGIARALYSDPDVLVFDEATSALDNITEKAVMDAVHNLSGEKTVIMIAHRLSTVANCDTIVALEGGKVVASGSYNDLMRSSEKFRELANPAR